jgi:hypothetical protein
LRSLRSTLPRKGSISAMSSTVSPKNAMRTATFSS